ncbi:hypothetical protein EBU99_05435 [bacterium]|nr:hypothetical protein [bacterium]
MWSFKTPSPAVAVCALAALVSLSSCTKSSSQSANSPAPVIQPPAPSTSAPIGNAPGSGNVSESMLSYSIASLAGEDLFCQTVTTKNQMRSADLEPLANALAGAQGNVPKGVLNPFTMQTLGLVINATPCNKIPALVASGHCEIAASQLAATGQIAIQTEQRILWKDVALLAQATSVQLSLDSKRDVIASKNAVLSSVQSQIRQQQLLLQILQAPNGNSTLISEAQALLTRLQEQTVSLDKDIKSLEAETKPIQDELNKTLDKLATARASLKLACNPVGMGADSAVWKDN